MTEIDPIPTLRDIAEAAGVSVATVSKVLNNRGGVGDESRQRILELAERFGYQGGRSARSLIKAGIDSALLIVPAPLFNEQFYTGVVQGIVEEASALSLKLDVQMLAYDDARANDQLDELLSRRASAIILVALDDPGSIDRIVAAGKPAVLINGMDRTMRIDTVLPDNWSTGWLATRRLLEAGHTEIRHVSILRRQSMRRRCDGFRTALEEAGIAFDPRVHIIDLGDIQASQGQDAIVRAYEAGRLNGVTALFASMDVLTIGILQGLQSVGMSIPDDISVISVDDIQLARHCRPPLTTMRIDREELGRVGVRQLIRRIEDPATSTSRLDIGATLIERATVGAPPRN